MTGTGSCPRISVRSSRNALAEATFDIRLRSVTRRPLSQNSSRSAFIDSGSESRPARDTGACVTCGPCARRRSRHAVCRSRSLARNLSTSLPRRTAACWPRRCSRHAFEHVFCVLRADATGRNHSRHSRQRRRSVDFGIRRASPPPLEQPPCRGCGAQPHGSDHRERSPQAQPLDRASRVVGPHPARRSSGARAPSPALLRYRPAPRWVSSREQHRVSSRERRSLVRPQRLGGLRRPIRR